MKQKEKNAMAREVVEFFQNQQNRAPVTITEPNEEYRALAERFGVTKETRRESYDAVKPDAAARRRVILEILMENGDGMTAREIAVELHRRGITPTDERNFAAPRLTELYQAGKVICTSKRLCPLSKRYVAVWTVRKE